MNQTGLNYTPLHYFDEIILSESNIIDFL